jgi:hydrogenase maturation protease
VEALTGRTAAADGTGGSPVSGGRRRLLVAGIGNIFLADDAFGPEVIHALTARPLPPVADVADFGIRGMDLAYRLLDGYDAALLVDAAPRGDEPGTLSLIEPDPGDLAAAVPEAHAMDPVKVLALARHLGDGALPRIVVVGCEPRLRLRGDEDVTVGLSAPVRAAVPRAVALLHAVVPPLAADPAAPLSTLGDLTELGRTEEFAAPPPPRPPWTAAAVTEDQQDLRVRMSPPPLAGGDAHGQGPRPEREGTR